ncbi:MAG: formyltransferase [Pseudomonadota bacterium]|nr:formyltransferase [Pseudomonadota bacterium]
MRAVVFAYSNVGDRCLRVLRAAGVEVPLVVTHRDRPGETLWFSRVAETADELGLPFIYGDDPNSEALAAAVAEARPDVIFSFYFRSLLPATLLDLAPAGAFNMHGSLLPKYRGRAPTNWAVLRGETVTGATLHFMLAKADAGAIVDQEAVPILPDDTGRQVFDKVTVAAELVLWRSLQSIVDGTPPRLVNDLASGSYFGARKPADGRIDWQQPAADVYNLIRAVAPPYPGAFTELAGVTLVIAEARLALPRRSGESLPAAAAPGLCVVADRIVGVCGDGGRIDVRSLLADGRPVDATGLRELLDAGRNEPITP